MTLVWELFAFMISSPSSICGHFLAHFGSKLPGKRNPLRLSKIPLFISTRIPSYFILYTIFGCCFFGATAEANCQQRCEFLVQTAEIIGACTHFIFIILIDFLLVVMLVDIESDRIPGISCDFLVFPVISCDFL